MHFPRGLVRIFRFFHQKSGHDINKLKFSRNTKFSNLSSEEWSALKSLKKRKDIVIKAADKGGAVFVWRADLYQKEALLETSAFYPLRWLIYVFNPVVNTKLPANDEGLRALKHFFDQRTVRKPSS